MRRFTEKHLVIASHNAGKIQEIAALLQPLGISVSSAKEHGLSDPPETETTFEGNARIKAHHVAKSTSLPALSDDSGIEIEALEGAPGVYTADWAETKTGRDFVMAMIRAWNELEAVAAPSPRRARFVCTLCLAWPDGEDAIVAGSVSGQIVWPMRGDQGFGFDPIFLPDGETETFGEMDSNKKQAMSHRSQAFARLLQDVFAQD